MTADQTSPTTKHEKRLGDREVLTDSARLRAFLGDGAYDDWLAITGAIENAYGIDGHPASYGKRYGVCLRYRVARRTLCALFPETGAVTVLVVLGAAEYTALCTRYDTVSTSARDIVETTEQLRDGRWVWLRIPNDASREDIRTILSVKRRPRDH